MEPPSDELDDRVVVAPPSQRDYRAVRMECTLYTATTSLGYRTLSCVGRFSLNQPLWVFGASRIVVDAPGRGPMLLADSADVEALRSFFENEVGPLALKLKSVSQATFFERLGGWLKHWNLHLDYQGIVLDWTMVAATTPSEAKLWQILEEIKRDRHGLLRVPRLYVSAVPPDLICCFCAEVAHPPCVRQGNALYCEPCSQKVARQAEPLHRDLVAEAEILELQCCCPFQGCWCCCGLLCSDSLSLVLSVNDCRRMWRPMSGSRCGCAPGFLCPPQLPVSATRMQLRL
jgi:hypothetical protein